MRALKNKDNFFLICDYTINNNYYMLKEEQAFLDNLIKNLKHNFRFKQFKILDGRGIIISGER